jgi:transposase-like protein
MTKNRASPLSVSERERIRPASLVRRHHCPQQVALRARIVPGAAAGQAVRESMRALSVARSTVRNWRRRWAHSESRVAERLADAPRQGTRPTRSAPL